MSVCLTETAFAKINLALHVRARRSDGYHDIETVFAFAQHGDVLTAQADTALSLTIDGPFAKYLDGGDDNLVIRAARALQRQTGTSRGAAIVLTKNLPLASGIGGGSADAAATLRLLNRLWRTGLSEQDLTALGAPLGADVAACVASRTCIGTGTGEKLSCIDGSTLKDKHLLLVNPGVSVPTGPVFQAWDGRDRGGLEQGGALETGLAGRNDLQVPAAAIVPQISDIIAELQRHDPIAARMSGSGATCFAMFKSCQSAKSARTALAKKWPDYWMMQTMFRTDHDQ